MTKSAQQLSQPILIRPFKSSADYLAALAEIDRMMGTVEPNTPEGDRFDLMVTLVETYEATQFPLGETSDPISIIEFVMEQQGLTRKDLEQFIGPCQRVWDIMERRRPLSLAMMHRLSDGLHIPAELLNQEYELSPAAA